MSKQYLKIALDYDGTFTEDPEMWLAFIGTCKARGHHIRIVTMRHPHECLTMNQSLLKTSIPIIFTSRKGKRAAALEQGFKVDVWIDDMPDFILYDAC